MRNILAIAQINKTENVSLWAVVKSDMIPWLMSAGFALLLFEGVCRLVGSIRPDITGADVAANVYSWARPFYFALVVLACFLARRSRDIWTWVLAGVLIVFFIPQTSINLAVNILPNSILQAMIAMVGFLAAGRLVEYIKMRYIIKLREPALRSGAIIGYCLLIGGALFFDVPLFFELFWR